MSDDINYLIESSQPHKDFDAGRMIVSALNKEFQALRSAANHSLLHKAQREHGYPIANDILETADYHPRSGLEKRLGEQIRAGANIFLLGCEGSGKTTLIHYTISRYFRPEEGLFIYVDTSDVNGADADLAGDFYSKLWIALYSRLNPELEDQFNSFLAKHQGNPALFPPNTPSYKILIQVLFCFVRTRSSLPRLYIIIDNIDSVSDKEASHIVRAADALSKSFNEMRAILYRRDPQNEDKDQVSFILSCRTPTYQFLCSASYGLFPLDGPGKISIDDDFMSVFEPIAMAETFITNRVLSEYSAPFDQVRIGLRKAVVIPLSAKDYFVEMIAWISRSKVAFNSIIKNLSGRSIRRAKIYALKVLSSPVLARMMILEKYDLISITDADFIERKVIEAIFDFSTHRYSDGNDFHNFPLNPFNVAGQADEQLHQPLLGAITLFYIHANRKDMFVASGTFADCIDLTDLISYLKAIGYHPSVFANFINQCKENGLLRPVLSSEIIEEGAGQYRSVYQQYILDVKALDFYMQILKCDDPKLSMIFYNSAMRADLKIESDHKADDIIYECYTSLLFLQKIIAHEGVIAEMNEERDVTIVRISLEIRSGLTRFITSVLATYTKRRGELFDRTYDLLNQIRAEMPHYGSLL